MAERHLAEIDLTEGRASLFSEARRKARTPPNGAEWFQQARLPEGSTYLGFLFFRGLTADEVEKGLREAHQRLQFLLPAALPVVK